MANDTSRQNLLSYRPSLATIAYDSLISSWLLSPSITLTFTVASTGGEMDGYGKQAQSFQAVKRNEIRTCVTHRFPWKLPFTFWRYQCQNRNSIIDTYSSFVCHSSCFLWSYWFTFVANTLTCRRFGAKEVNLSHFTIELWRLPFTSNKCYRLPQSLASNCHTAWLLLLHV